MKHILNGLKDRTIFRLKAFDGVPHRLFDELDYLNENGGAEALLLLSDLVRYLKSEDIYVGPGYNHTTCSLVCYGAGITDVNPLVWNLPFECFTRTFKPGRTITIVTSEGGWEKAKEYILGKYGYLAIVSKDRKNALDVTLLDDNKYDWLQVQILTYPELDVLKILSSERSTSLNLLKLDEKTLETFRECETDGLWVFSNAQMKEQLKIFMPECFSDLYILYALYRPDFMDRLREVTRRKNENDYAATGIPDIDRILMESYGVIVYQEQSIAIQKVLLRLADDAVTSEMRERLNAPYEALFPKGHAIAMTMIIMELAFFKTRCPDKFYAALAKINKDKFIDAK